MAYLTRPVMSKSGEKLGGGGMGARLGLASSKRADPETRKKTRRSNVN